MVNRDQVIAYLLNELPEVERAAFAERWFTDRELYERIQMAEAALLDDYVNGRLSRERRRQVETSLLGCDIQQRKLEFASALRRALPSPRRFQVSWMAIAAAALIIAIGLSVWLVVEKRNPQKNHPVMRASVASPSVDVFTLSLPADTLRGETTPNTIQLSSNIRLLKLELELRPGDEANIYTATVSAGRRTVWTENAIHAEGVGKDYQAVIRVPAGILTPDDYTVRLDVSGTPIGSYRFTVRK